MKRGSKHKESSKVKMANAHKGKPLSDSHRRNLIGSHKGYKHTEETKRKIGLANSIDIGSELLKLLYVEQELTIKQVADRIHVSGPTVHRNLMKLGIVRTPSQARQLNRKDANVYREVRIPSHPRAHKNGCVREHIVVWERAHGQPLPDGWVIHHLNGLKNDNRSENLIAMASGNHSSGLVNEALRKRIRELEATINEYDNHHDL